MRNTSTVHTYVGEGVGVALSHLIITRMSSPCQSATTRAQLNNTLHVVVCSRYSTCARDCGLS